MAIISKISEAIPLTGSMSLRKEGNVLDDNYLKMATEQVPDRMILVVLAAKRAKELAHGAYPMVPVDRGKGVNHLDVALQEIAEGKLFYEPVKKE